MSDREYPKTMMIDAVKYVREDSIESIAMGSLQDGLKPVLVRTYAAGVHFGYLKSAEHNPAGKTVTLVNSRRAWFWSGAASLSQMAVDGVANPKDCKFSVVVPEISVEQVIETIPLSEKAVKNLYGVSIWKN